MPGRNKRIRTAARLDGRKMAAAVALKLGTQIGDARKSRGWSQRQLGEKIGISPSRIGQLERGRVAGASVELLCSLSVALGVLLRLEFARDASAGPADAGHLALQELALRLGRETGRPRTFELATRPLDTGHSIDVCLRDDAHRVLIVEECWNTFGNINASVRSTRRKIAEAEQLAVAIGDDAGPYRVAAVWIVRDTRANRALLARYPEVFGAAFTGSSSGWVTALMDAAPAPPIDLGLVWCDVRATRLFPWRKPRAAA